LEQIGSKAALKKKNVVPMAQASGIKVRRAGENQAILFSFENHLLVSQKGIHDATRLSNTAPCGSMMIRMAGVV
jgi:hypothetical protein